MNELKSFYHDHGLSIFEHEICGPYFILHSSLAMLGTPYKLV